MILLNKFKKQAGWLIFLLLPLNIAAQNNLVPNTLDCAGTRPPFSFSISELWNQPGVSNYSTPLVGDLDGDHKTEILIAGVSQNILIFDGATGTSVGTIPSGVMGYDETNPYVIVDVEGDGKAEILVVKTVSSFTPTATLYTVTSAPGVRPITFGTKWQINLPTDVQDGAGAIPVVADLDGDGLPEFVVAFYIIRSDGTICQTRMNNSGGIMLDAPDRLYFPYVADLDGDSRPEIIVGTDVYKYNGTSATLWKRCPSFPQGKEGSNMAADIDLDGIVDLVYHDNSKRSDTGQIIVWTPLLAPAPGVSSTQGIIGSFPTVSIYRTYPVVGDIDGIVSPNGKKYPEICFNASRNIFRAMSFNGTSFSQKFQMTTNEGSGYASFTYFDFNLDGILELVYRDEQLLRILNATGSMPVTVFSMPATSNTVIEMPVVADVTGDGSADIIVTGSGSIHVFEGASSKWASCPPVWNQQLYSNLLINTDLTVISNIGSAARIDTDCHSQVIRMYNGGPMQAPYVSESTFCPIDLSPDIYIVSGGITILSPTSVTINLTIANQGLAMMPANMPIRFYQNSISSGNIISSANMMLGVDLYPKDTMTITQTITGLSPSWVALYARLLDDGVNFPAAGTFSDCDLTNNVKSFGTLELTKTVDYITGCIFGESMFTIQVKNDGTTAYNNIVVTDSLQTGWTFISAFPSTGTSVSTFDSATRLMNWTIPALVPGDSAVLIIRAQEIILGSLRNYSWITSVGGTQIEQNFKTAYVIVSSNPVPSPPTISPSGLVSVCSPATSVLLTVLDTADSYQWYKDGVPILGATSATYLVNTAGHYYATLFDGSCTSEMSDTANVLFGGFIQAYNDYAQTFVNTPVSVSVLNNDSLGCCKLSGLTALSIVSGQNGKHGTATFSGNTLIYTPNANFIGKDSITYTYACTGIATTAKVYFTILDFPDNVTDADCYINRPAGAWSIKQRFASNTVAGGAVFEMSVPLVGDIDGDGIVEIVVAGQSTATNNFNCDSIKVFDGLHNTVKNKFKVEAFHGGFGTIAMADVDKDGFAEVFVASNFAASAGNQGYIFCYKYDGTLKWKSAAVYTANATSHSYPYLKITDFNGDGIPEILANDRIFNAVTGDLLLDCGLIAGGLDYGTNGGHNSYYPGGYFGNFSSDADMDGDALPEIVAGRNIYKISINSLTNPALNSRTLLRSVIPGTHSTDLGDGYTSVADLNLDGTLDVIVLRQNPAARATKYLYAWDGKTGELLHTNIVSLNDGNGSYGGSIPFVGDLDGDGVPEISFTLTSRLHAYKLNKNAKTLNPMAWSPLTTTDGSGATTLTLFDFNQDNQMELVYRDQDNLRIVDGMTGQNKTTIPCFSWTMNEYPVVADVTGGGHANIVVLGKPAAASHGNGYLYVFEHDLSVSGAIPWAPTRKVWNQWAYNVVNINEDLTVPKYQMNPATVFSGSDSVLGTSDDVRPYNGFLMQQTLIDKRGVPIWLTPNVYTTLPLIQTTASKNAVTVSVKMVNQGDAAIGSPVYATLYKKKTPQTFTLADTIATGSANIQILPGDTGTVTVFIPNITKFFPMTDIVIRLNDNGLVFPVQPECDTTNDTLTISVSVKADSTYIKPNADTVYICYNTSPSLSVQTALVPSPKFRWYDTQTSTAILHEGSTFVPNPLKASRSYFVSVHDTTGPLYENDINNRREIRVVVYDSLRAGVIGSSHSVCITIQPNVLQGLLAKSGGSNTVSYQWQSSSDSLSWSNISGATATTYSPNLLSTTTFFRRIDMDGTCGTVYTNVIKVTVNNFPALNTEITGPHTVCVGNTIQLSNTTTGGVWTVNNSNATIVNPNANPETITGAAAGNAYITYTTNSGQCETKKTFLLKVIPPTAPTIKIGFEH